MRFSRRKFIKTGLIYVPTTALAGTTTIRGPLAKLSNLVVSGPTDQPSNYSTLIKGWYRAFDLSLSDGDPVSTWTDRTTNANNFTGTGTARPTFKTNILSGKPAIRFDGVDDYLISGTTFSFPFGANNAFTVIALMVPASGGGFYFAWSANPSYLLYPNGGTNQVRLFDTATGVNSSVFSNAVTNAKVVTVRRDGSYNISFRENKTAKGTGNDASTGFTANCIGRVNGGSGGAFTGDVLELAVWNTNLSDANVDSLYDNYFKFYYSSLP